MKTKDKIKEIRKEIDKIDLKILELLNLRAKKVKSIFEEKDKNKIPFFDPSREKKIVDKLQKFNKGPLTRKDIEIIMDGIFKVYRSINKPLTIAYFGPSGTFTHQAALKRFGEKSVYVPCRTIENVFKEVEKERVDYGVVPIENSSEGVVTHTLDMFLESDVEITSEILLKIHHYLLSKEKSIQKIKKIYSHSQAFAQCQKWIEEHLKNAILIETESTSTAAERVKKERNSASIGSEIGAKIYNLNILAEKIEDFKENITRFLVIGRSSPEESGNDKTSILFSIKDRVGALHDMLVPFKEYNINLTRIESRPSKKKAWEYVFFVDFIGHKNNEKVKKALAKLKKNCIFLKILGSYPQAE